VNEPEGASEVIEYVEADGQTYPATDGEVVRNESIIEGKRVWSPRRSKAGALLVKDPDVELGEYLNGGRVLYLGAGAGTTPSYFADLARVVYAVEFAPSPASGLIEVARNRDRLVPLFADAREPSEYAPVVEGTEVLYQDVATRGQASVAVKNSGFVRDGGKAYVVVKARSEDVTAEPEDIYTEVAEELEESGEYVVEKTVELSPFYDDHAVVIANRQDTQR